MHGKLNESHPEIYNYYYSNDHPIGASVLRFLGQVIELG